MQPLNKMRPSSDRIDAESKASGRTQYAYDIKLPNMLFGKIKRSRYAHARVKCVDVSKALTLPGVKAVLTGSDLPRRRFGYGLDDQEFIARDVVRFVGEPVAAVAAESSEIAEDALDLIEVDYEELPAIFDPRESMSIAPSVILHPEIKTYARTFVYSNESYERPNVASHYKIRCGDIFQKFEENDITLESTYRISRIQHAPLEPHSCVAEQKPDGSFVIWTQSQQPYLLMKQLEDVTGIPSRNFRIIVPPMGGGFGNKTQMLLEPFAVALCTKTRRPVKIVLTREEVFTSTTSRTPMEITVKDRVSRKGKIKARQVEIVLDAGGYSGESYIVNRNAGFGAVGSYSIPNFTLDSYCVYTCNPVGGAYRGFGSMEVQFAIEQQMDRLAKLLSMDPLEFRSINILRKGDRDVMGEEVTDDGLKLCLDAIRREIQANPPPLPSQDKNKLYGRGIAIGNKYSLAPTASAAFVKVHTDGSLEVRASAIEMGQGVYSTLARIVADVFKCDISNIKVLECDTAVTPFDIGAISSRSTHTLGSAVKSAAEDARRQVLELAGRKLEIDPDDLDIRAGKITLNADPNDARLKISDIFRQMFQFGLFLEEGGELIGKATRIEGAEIPDFETGQVIRGKAVAYYSYTAQVADIEIEKELGTLRILKILVVCDCGSVINQRLLESQIEGGIVMGLGGALYEELILEDGVTLNPDFLNYKVPTMADIPDSINITLVDSQGFIGDPTRAKGGGEVSLVVTAATVANAIFDASGARITELPLSRERIRGSLEKMQKQTEVKKALRVSALTESRC